MDTETEIRVPVLVDTPGELTQFLEDTGAFLLTHEFLSTMQVGYTAKFHMYSRSRHEMQQELQLVMTGEQTYLILDRTGDDTGLVLDTNTCTHNKDIMWVFDGTIDYLPKVKGTYGQYIVTDQEQQRKYIFFLTNKELEDLEDGGYTVQPSTHSYDFVEAVRELFPDILGFYRYRSDLTDLQLLPRDVCEIYTRSLTVLQNRDVRLQ